MSNYSEEYNQIKTNRINAQKELYDFLIAQRSQLAANKENLENVSRALETCNTEKAAAELSLRDLQKQLESLTNEYDEFKKTHQGTVDSRITALDGEISELGRLKETLEATIAEKNAAISALEGSDGEKAATIAEMQKRIAKLEEEIGNNTSTINDAQARLANLESLNKDRENEIRDLKKENLALTEENKTINNLLKTTGKANEEKVAKLEQKINENNATIDSNNNAIADLKQKIKETDEEIDKLNKQANDANADNTKAIRELNDVIADNKKTIDALEAKGINDDGEIERLKKELQEAHDSCASKLKELQSAHDSLEELLRAKDQQIMQLSEKLAGALDRKNELANDENIEPLKTLDQNITDVLALIEEIKNGNKNKIDELETKLKEVSAELSKVLGKNEEIIQFTEKVIADLDASNQNQQALKELSDELKREQQKLQEKIKEHEMNSDDLQKNLNSQIAALKKSLEECTKEKNEIVAKLAQREEFIAKMKRMLANKDDISDADAERILRNYEETNKKLINEIASILKNANSDVYKDSKAVFDNAVKIEATAALVGAVQESIKETINNSLNALDKMNGNREFSELILKGLNTINIKSIPVYDEIMRLISQKSNAPLPEQVPGEYIQKIDGIIKNSNGLAQHFAIIEKIIEAAQENDNNKKLAKHYNDIYTLRQNYNNYSIQQASKIKEEIEREKEDLARAEAALKERAAQEAARLEASKKESFDAYKKLLKLNEEAEKNYREYLATKDSRIKSLIKAYRECLAKIVEEQYRKKQQEARNANTINYSYKGTNYTVSIGATDVQPLGSYEEFQLLTYAESTDDARKAFGALMRILAPQAQELNGETYKECFNAAATLYESVANVKSKFDELIKNTMVFIGNNSKPLQNYNKNNYKELEKADKTEKIVTSTNKKEPYITDTGLLQEFAELNFNPESFSFDTPLLQNIAKDLNENKPCEDIINDLKQVNNKMLNLVLSALGSIRVILRVKGPVPENSALNRVSVPSNELNRDSDNIEKIETTFTTEELEAVGIEENAKISTKNLLNYFDSSADNKKVYESKKDATSVNSASLKDLLLDYVNGANVTAYAYGGSGSGKTYTLINKDNPGQGIINYFAQDILEKISSNDASNPIQYKSFSISVLELVPYTNGVVKCIRRFSNYDENTVSACGFQEPIEFILPEEGKPFPKGPCWKDLLAEERPRAYKYAYNEEIRNDNNIKPPTFTKINLWKAPNYVIKDDVDNSVSYDDPNKLVPINYITLNKNDEEVTYVIPEYQEARDLYAILYYKNGENDTAAITEYNKIVEKMENKEKKDFLPRKFTINRENNSYQIINDILEYTFHNDNRQTGRTPFNQFSSRSHAFVEFHLEYTLNGEAKKCKAMIADLAGIERQLGNNLDVMNYLTKINVVKNLTDNMLNAESKTTIETAYNALVKSFGHPTLNGSEENKRDNNNASLFGILKDSGFERKNDTTGINEIIKYKKTYHSQIIKNNLLENLIPNLEYSFLHKYINSITSSIDSISKDIYDIYTNSKNWKSYEERFKNIKKMFLEKEFTPDTLYINKENANDSVFFNENNKITSFEMRGYDYRYGKIKEYIPNNSFPEKQQKEWLYNYDNYTQIKEQEPSNGATFKKILDEESTNYFTSYAIIWSLRYLINFIKLYNENPLTIRIDRQYNITKETIEKGKMINDATAFEPYKYKRVTILDAKLEDEIINHTNVNVINEILNKIKYSSPDNDYKLLSGNKLNFNDLSGLKLANSLTKSLVEDSKGKGYYDYYSDFSKDLVSFYANYVRSYTAGAELIGYLRSQYFYNPKGKTPKLIMFCMVSPLLNEKESTYSNAQITIPTCNFAFEISCIGMDDTDCKKNNDKNKEKQDAAKAAAELAQEITGPKTPGKTYPPGPSSSSGQRTPTKNLNKTTGGPGTQGAKSPSITPTKDLPGKKSPSSGQKTPRGGLFSMFFSGGGGKPLDAIVSNALANQRGGSDTTSSIAANALYEYALSDSLGESLDDSLGDSPDNFLEKTFDGGASQKELAIESAKNKKVSVDVRVDLSDIIPKNKISTTSTLSKTSTSSTTSTKTKESASSDDDEPKKNPGSRKKRRVRRETKSHGIDILQQTKSKEFKKEKSDSSSDDSTKAKKSRNKKEKKIPGQSILYASANKKNSQYKFLTEVDEDFDAIVTEDSSDEDPEEKSKKKKDHAAADIPPIKKKSNNK